MKILIINPNSSAEMTAGIRKAAEDFAGGDFSVLCLATPGAPEFIETYEDQAKAAPGMIRLLRDHEKECDAFINACHCDPQLDALKEITAKPVVGIGEASMKIASMLGHRFSVVSASAHSIPNKEALIQKYHLESYLASIRPIPGDWKNEDNIFRAAQAAVREDLAEVIVLGCAGLAGLDKRLEKRLGAPVLDGVVCALIIAVGLAKYGAGISKIGRYAMI
jgi:allantoin racemase